MNFGASTESVANKIWPLPKWIPHKPKTDCEGSIVRLERTMLREEGRCIYCGLDLISNTELLLSAGLDHLVPQEAFRSALDAGYTKTGDYRTNLVFCCRPCNDAKGNWPLCLLPEEAKNILTLNTRDAYLAKAKTYTIGRRRSEEKQAARLMAKAWTQRAAKLGANKGQTTVLSSANKAGSS